MDICNSKPACLLVSDILPALLFIVTNGGEVLVRSAVMRTGLVYLLLNVCEYIVMLLLLVSINTLEQLISES